MSNTPTSEQSAAVDVFMTGDNVRVYAGAGTGKTTALRFMAERATGRRGLYLAFNKSVAMDARKRFAGTGVDCSTVHALAYRTHGASSRQRLNQKFLFWPQKAKALGITDKFPIGGTFLTRQTLVRLAEETVTAFCRSMQPEITEDLVSLPATILGTAGEKRQLRQRVAGAARLWWDDWMRPDGVLAHRHDTYLKRFSLDAPEFGYDFILADEAQDLEPLTVGLLGAQNAQIVAVGDTNQAIYQWRGAIDALDMFGGERVNLTQSFRFGSAIADEANFWLELLGADIRLRGLPDKDSSVWPSNREPEAVLTRSNGGSMLEVIEAQRKGLAVGIAGERKAKELTSLAQAAIDLQEKGKTNHRDLDVFDSWEAVRAFVEEEPAGSDIAALVKVVDTYGATDVLRAIEQAVPAAKARQVVSTVHVAKGLEWRHVRVADDFREPGTDKSTGEQKPLEAEEARLAYVAVTRAQRHLDPSGLAWARKMTGGVEGVTTSAAVPA